MRKKILFVINTMGRAGAETAMLELLKALDSPEYDISLYVIMGQGEMIGKLPPYVRLRNLRFNAHSVLSRQGKRGMMATVCRAFFRNGGQIKKYAVSQEILHPWAGRGNFRRISCCGGCSRTEACVWKSSLTWRWHGWRALPLTMWRSM